MLSSYRLDSWRTKRLTYRGTKFLLDNEPFYLQGVSFFNALYNPAFNRSAGERGVWLDKFKSYGINMIRLWCQWDLKGDIAHFIDVTSNTTMYSSEGSICGDSFQKLTGLLEQLNERDMAAEVVLFSNEKGDNLPLWAMERAAWEMAAGLIPYRNVILQIWNEKSVEVKRFYDTIKFVDPLRIVTNSPGVESLFTGDDDHNVMMDILTPHTTRNRESPFYRVAPLQVEFLLEKYKKPVIDDEPARNGIILYGGIEGGTKPEQHIEQIQKVRAAGGYHVYHHDMFQNEYDHPAIPPHGIPDPEWSPFHKIVFEFLRDHKTW